MDVRGKWTAYVAALARGTPRSAAFVASGLSNDERTRLVYLAPVAEAAAAEREEAEAEARGRVVAYQQAPDNATIRAEARLAAQRVLALDRLAIEDQALPWAERSKAKDRIVAIAQLVGSDPKGAAVVVPIQIVVRTERGPLPTPPGIPELAG